MQVPVNTPQRRLKRTRTAEELVQHKFTLYRPSIIPNTNLSHPFNSSHTKLVSLKKKIKRFKKIKIARGALGMSCSDSCINVIIQFCVQMKAYWVWRAKTNITFPALIHTSYAD